MNQQRARKFGACVVACALSMSVTASAQPAVADAELLFEQGRELAGAGNYDEACPKFEASLRLDPALGTRMNLADCYEASGKLASAWSMYRSAADMARVQRDPREQLAATRAAALKPKLPRLVIRLEGTPTANMTLVRSGAAIEPAMLGAESFVDPGRIVVTASAPGYVTFTVTVEAIEGASVEAVIPPLVPDGASPSVQPPRNDAALAPIAPPGSMPLPMPSSTGSDVRSEGGGRALRYGVAGGGIVLIGAGLAIGASAKNLYDSAFDDDLCDRATNECTAEGLARTNRSRTRANISNVAIGAGVAAVGVATYLFIRSRSSAPVHAGVVPTVDANGGAGLVWLGAF